MKRFLFSSILMVLFALGVQTASAEEDIRRFLLLVDYIGSDYAMAVQGGKVINALEYQEMQTFSADALSLFSLVPSPPEFQHPREIQRDLRKLQELVENKQAPSDVSAVAKRIRDATVALYGVETFPLRPPSLRKGRGLYTENCAACHGADGIANTRKAKEFNPPPANFRAPSVMETLSPFKAFNVLSFGIPGTAMASFDALSEQDRWNLAFYLFSLRFSDGGLEKGMVQWNRRLKKEGLGDLKTLSSLTDRELLERLADEEITSAKEKISALAFLRSELPGHITLDPLSRTFALLRRSSNLVQEGKQQEAYLALLEAYLDGFESLEPQLRASQVGKVSEVEKAFLALRLALNADGGETQAEALFARLFDELEEVRDLLNMKR